MMTTSIRDVPGHGPVEVRRSARRKRTVSAFREQGRLVVAIPATFTRAEEEQWVEKLVRRVNAREVRRELSDEDLFTRAEALAREYLPTGVRPSSVRWVTNQNSRWGSCTPLDGSIRISHRVRNMPEWVIDYVLVHELAHLVHADHSARFWAIVDQYPRTQRARGFLEGASFQAAHGDWAQGDRAQGSGAQCGDAPDRSEGDWEG